MLLALLLAALATPVAALHIRGTNCARTGPGREFAKSFNNAVLDSNNNTMMFQVTLTSNSTVVDTNTTTNMYTTLGVRVTYVGKQIRYSPELNFCHMLRRVARANVTGVSNYGFGNFTVDGPKPDHKPKHKPGVPPPSIFNPWNKIDNSLVEWADASNPGSLCPLDPGDMFEFQYEFDVGSFHTFGTYLVRFLLVDPNEAHDTLGCVEFEATPVQPASILHFAFYGVLALCIVSLVAGTFTTAFSAHQEAQNPFLFIVSTICNTPLLDLLTPTITDVLHYTQTAFFLVTMNLNYPGFLQPVMLLIAPFLLMGIGIIGTRMPASLDGLYDMLWEQGLGKLTLFMSQSLRLSLLTWFNMVVTLFIVIAGRCLWSEAVLWILRLVRNKTVPEKDPVSRAVDAKRNAMYLLGYAIETVYLGFCLPFLTLTVYQLKGLRDNSENAPVDRDAYVWLSVVGLVLVLAFVAHNAWIVYYFTFRRVAVYLSLSFILAYWSVFSNLKLTKLFWWGLQVLLVVLRAVVIGAIDNGVAQVLLVAMAELVYLCCALWFQPYHLSPSLSYWMMVPVCCRLLVLLLNIAYIPGLQVAERLRLYVAYTQLAIHLLMYTFYTVHVVRCVVGAIRNRHDDTSEQRKNPLADMNPFVLSRDPSRSDMPAPPAMGASENDLLRYFRGHNYQALNDSFATPSTPPRVHSTDSGQDARMPHSTLQIHLFDRDFLPDAFGQNEKYDYTFRESDLRFNKGLYRDPEVAQLWDSRQAKPPPRPAAALRQVTPQHVESLRQQVRSLSMGLGRRLRKWVALGKTPPVVSLGFEVLRPKRLVVQKFNPAGGDYDDMKGDLAGTSPQESGHNTMKGDTADTSPQDSNRNTMCTQSTQLPQHHARASQVLYGDGENATLINMRALRVDEPWVDGHRVSEELDRFVFDDVAM